MKKLFRRSPRGAALLMLSYLTAVTLSLLVFSFVSRQALNEHSSSLYAEREQVYFLAESGVEQMIDWIRKNPATASAWPQNGTNVAGGNAPVATTWNPALPTDLGWGSTAVGNGRVQVSVYKHATIPDLYLVRSQGTVPSQLAAGRTLTKTIQSWVSVGNFARFNYFSLSLPISTWIGTGNTFTGPVQFNGRMQVRGNPIFQQSVSTSAPRIIYPGGTRPDGVTPVDTVNNNPSYLAGIPQVNASLQPFPAALPPSLQTHAQADGTSWNVPTTIHLEADGTVTVTNSVVGTQNMPIPSNGVIFIDGQATVSGTLSGKLTIATTGEIVVTNHTTYAHNLSQDPTVNGGDSLGLVAVGAVRVATTAPNDLHLSATIMSLTDGLKIDGVENTPPTVPAKGSMYLYGSLLEYQSRPKRRIDRGGNTTNGYMGQYTYNPYAAITDGAPDIPNGTPTELSRERL